MFQPERSSQCSDFGAADRQQKPRRIFLRNALSANANCLRCVSGWVPHSSPFCSSVSPQSSQQSASLREKQRVWPSLAELKKLKRWSLLQERERELARRTGRENGQLNGPIKAPWTIWSSDQREKESHELGTSSEVPQKAWNVDSSFNNFLNLISCT